MTSTQGVKTAKDAEALVLGLGMFGTGGGGLAERGRGYLRSLFEDRVEVTWVPLGHIDPDVLTCSVYGMGSIAPHPPMNPAEMRSFGVDGERHARPWIRAVEELESYLGEPIGAIVPMELGPSNTLVAVDAAARTGRALIDGDYIGRALPKMSQALPAILGLDTWPLAICDPWGNALIMLDCPSPKVAERIGKMVSRVTKTVNTGASCSHAAFPNRASRLAGAIVPGTLSRSLEIGHRVLEARSVGGDAIAAAVNAGSGCLLFRGSVTNRSWEDTADGYMEGTTVITGADSYADSTAKIWFQNEHHVFWRDDSVAASSPDVIAVVDVENGEPISNTELEPGRDVAVLGFKAPSAYRSGLALAATAPRHYGFDIDWVPIEQLNPNGSWQ